MIALAFHYQTQPLPNTQAWFFYRLPLFLHQASGAFMFIVELLLPFALFFGEWSRAIAGLGFIGLQLMIWFTGNFSYLNYLTACFSLIAFSHTFFPWITPPVAEHPSFLGDLALTVLGSFFVMMQLIRLWHHFFPDVIWQRGLNYFAPFHLFNPYGIFAVMTTKRYEIIVEGSEDGIEWKEYLFKYKPSEVWRRPRRVAPYQPRLDWQMWFLPFNHFKEQEWFHSFLFHVLKGTPDVLKLLRNNPFGDQPPRYLRAVMYEYEFSTPKEKRVNGSWWKRTYVGPFSPVLSLPQSITS